MFCSSRIAYFIGFCHEVVEFTWVKNANCYMKMVSPLYKFIFRKKHAPRLEQYTNEPRIGFQGSFDVFGYIRMLYFCPSS